MEMYDLQKKRLLFKPWQKKKSETNKETKRKGASHSDERRLS